MKKFKLSKILILVLAVALICTGFVIAVSADNAATPNTVSYTQDGEEKTGDIVTAVSKADEGSTIKLLGDYQITDSTSKYGINFTKEVILDLNGYTIDSTNTNRLFSLSTFGTSFTITGNGTINIAEEGGPFLKTGGNTSTTFEDGNNMFIRVIGTGKGITINHNSAKALAEIQLGTVEFKNVTIHTKSTTHVFNSNSLNGAASQANYKFEGVEINATSAVAGTYTVVSSKTDLNTISMDYCNIKTNGHSIIGVVQNAANKISNYITVNNSYLSVNRYDDASTVIYNNYGTLASDITFTNSTLALPNRLRYSSNVNDSSIVFDNCDLLFTHSSGNFFRSVNVKLVNGTRIHSTYDNIKIHDNYDNNGAMSVEGKTGVHLIIGEGTRLGANFYDKLVNNQFASIPGYTDSSIVYSDGSTPTSSETYEMIYNPSSDLDSPYVVVKKGSTVNDPNVSAWESVLAFIPNPNSVTAYNLAGTLNKDYIYNNGNNAFLKWVSNGTTVSSGSATNLRWLIDEAVAPTAKSVIVYDFDIGSDSEVGFAQTRIGLHATDASGADKTYGNFLEIKNDGSVHLAIAQLSNGSFGWDTYADSDTGIDLAHDAWNHITIVIDTNDANGYIYINGQYIGSHIAYKDGALLQGPRFTFDANNANKKSGTGLAVDNITIRAYGNAPAANTIIDNGSSYLVNEGKTWNEFATISLPVTIGALPVDNVNSALKMSEKTGLPVKLNADINNATVISRGIVYTNGFNFNVANDSIPYTTIQSADGVSIDAYDFGIKLSGLKANLSLYSDFLVNLYIPEEFAQYIVSVNGAALDTTTVTIGDVQYFKAVVSKTACEAYQKAKFEIILTDGGKHTVSISILDYAERILKGDYTLADRRLMIYMLNYIYEAEMYFTGGENYDALALYMDMYNPDYIANNYAEEAIESENLSDTFESASIVLEETPVFRFVLNQALAFKGTVTITYGGVNVREFTIDKAANEVYKLDVHGMKIYNFGTTLKITVKPDDGEEKVSYFNLAAYANYHLNNANDFTSPTRNESDRALGVISALYEYVKVSEMYKAGTLGE